MAGVRPNSDGAGLLVQSSGCVEVEILQLFEIEAVRCQQRKGHGSSCRIRDQVVNVAVQVGETEGDGEQLNTGCSN
jgi:hypothetical protein